MDLARLIRASAPRWCTRIARCAQLATHTDSVNSEKRFFRSFEKKDKILKKPAFFACTNRESVRDNTHTAAVRCNTLERLITMSNEKTFAESIKAISDKRVATMTKKIEASFERRDQFEGANAENKGSSYCVNRDKVLANSVAVSKLFIALNVEPSDVIERKVSSAKMFNAKALKKIVELAQFACGVRKVEKIEKVMTAFIICACKYSASNEGAIDNAHNKAFLSSVDLSQIIADESLADYLADYRHAYISGGKDTQSSQARNVLDVLGLGEIVNSDSRYRGAIKVNRDHAFLASVVNAATK